MSVWVIDDEGMHRPQSRAWEAAQLQSALEALGSNVSALDLGGLALTPEHMRWLGRWEGFERLEQLWLGYTGITLEHMQALLSGHTPHELYMMELSGTRIAGVESEVFDLVNQKLPAIEHLALAFLESLPPNLMGKLCSLAVLDLTFTNLEYNALMHLSQNANQPMLVEELYMACTGRHITYRSVIALLKSRRVDRLAVLDARGCNLGHYQELSQLSASELRHLFHLEELYLEGNLLTEPELESLMEVATETFDDLEARLRPYLRPAKNIQQERYSRQALEFDVRGLTADGLRAHLKTLELQNQELGAVTRWFEVHES